MWSVTFVVRICPCELLQHLLSGSRRLARIQQALIALQLSQPEGHEVTSSAPVQFTAPTSKTKENQGNKERTHLPLHILRIILPINLARRRLILQLQRRIPDLRRQPILQVQETRLADVLNLGTGLADDGGLVAHACSGVPAEDGEGTGAGATGAAVFLFGLCVKVKR